MTGVTYCQESNRSYNLFKEWPLTPIRRLGGGEPRSVTRGNGDAGHRKPEAATVEKFHFVVDGLRGNIFLGVS